MRAFSVACFSLSALASLAAAQEDYSTWAYNESIKVNTAATGGGAGTTTVVTGFPVLVRLTSAQATVFAQAKAGGADIRFRRGAATVLPYQIERWDTAGKAAEIWVRLDSVQANNSTQAFTMYWGKSTAADSSKGVAVFDTAGGYQGVWHFNGSVNDATRNAYNGVDNGTGEAAGAVGRGRSFNESSSISLGNPAKMRSGDADRFTIESWVNWTSIGTGSSDRYRTIINHGTTNNADQFFMYARNPSSGGDDPYYAFGYYTGSASNNATYPGIASDASTWVHVTGVYDGTEWRVYRNGILGGSTPKDGAPVNSSADWIIGAWGTSRYFLGTMDEIRFSNRARSADWIKLAHATQKPGSTAVIFGTPAALRDAGGPGAETFGVASSSTGVTFTLPAGAGRALLTVSDMRGKILWSRDANLGSRLSWSGKGLPSGTYAARAIVRDGAQAGRSYRKNFVLAR
jgi:biopolymer transport protein ExbB